MTPVTAAMYTASTATQETLRSLLVVKLQYLSTLSTIYMTWWVSSVVFCGSVLGVVWINRNQFMTMSPFVMRLFFILVLSFFLSIVTFGWWGMITTSSFEHDALTISAALNIDNNLYSEFTQIWGGILIGTTSFCIVTIMWIGIWITLEVDRARHRMNDGDG
jgi:hypothetical protein